MKKRGRTPEELAAMRARIRRRSSDADVLRRVQAAIDRHDPAGAARRRERRAELNDE